MTLTITFEYAPGEQWPYKAIGKFPDGRMVFGSSKESYAKAQIDCIEKAKVFATLAAEKPPEPITVEI